MFPPSRRWLLLTGEPVEQTRACPETLAVFGEFEREMIVARVNAGLARARRSGTKSGKAIGRPKGADYDRKSIRAALLRGASVREVVREKGPASERRQQSARNSLKQVRCRWAPMKHN